MAYDNTSTHPVTTALIRQAGEGDANAGALAEQLELVFYTDDAAAAQALKLPNTIKIEVRDDDGDVSVFAYDANEGNAHDGVQIIADQDGRKFVVTRRTLTQAAYDALTYKPANTFYEITES